MENRRKEERANIYIFLLEGVKQCNRAEQILKAKLQETFLE